MSLQVKSSAALTLVALVGTCLAVSNAQGPPRSANPWTIDFRYAPDSWQTAICLPDDWAKTLVGKDGALLYDFPGKFKGFGMRVVAGLTNRTDWVDQQLVGPRVPIVQTRERAGAIELLQEAFCVAPPRGVHTPADSGPLENAADVPVRHEPRHNVILLHLQNSSPAPTVAVPTLTIESETAIDPQADHHHLQIGSLTRVFSQLAFTRTEVTKGKLVLVFPEQLLPGGGECTLAFGVVRGSGGEDLPQTAAEAKALRDETQSYWEKLELPYGHFEIPDPGVQALLDSAVRNIYQGREIKKGLPAFQVGPTCYRGLWVVDGSFLLEAVTYLGRTDEARNGIKYLLSFQRDDGGIMLIDGHWKETGIALWAVTRHARLTSDKAWLREVWPKVERGVAYVGRMRELASQKPNAPNTGLIPDGFSDGGLADKVPEYTNVYWTLVGLRAAVEAARWLEQTPQAKEWQQQYDDFYSVFRHAAERDAQIDAQGNRYVPIRMAKGEGVPPQKAQWAFLHSVFPGRLYSPGDPLLQGNMAMLRAVEAEGLIQDTGWLKDGIWNYFGSFYGHAWLWLGDGDKAARTLYAFGNHASPLLCWREEQQLVGSGPQVVGDMPHNWASAEFIRLVRHALLLEREDALHLFEGLPAVWARPGTLLRVNDVLTEFGPTSLELRVRKDGSAADLSLTPPTRCPPKQIVLHLDNWTGQKGTLELGRIGPVKTTIHLETSR
jgi:hypothetical protein